MGGKAAKERRRLQRLALQEGSTAVETKKDLSRNAPHESTPRNPRKEKNSFSPRKSPQERNFNGNSREPKHVPPHLRKTQSTGTKKPVVAKKKFKKPKHLKRKIEKAGEEEEIKEKLEKELEEFRKRKSLFSTNRPLGRKLDATLKMKNVEQHVKHKEIATIASHPTETPPDKEETDAKPIDSPTENMSSNEIRVDNVETSPPAVQERNDSDSDSESDVSLAENTKRQRGRRRRGRVDTSKIEKETKTEAPAEPLDDEIDLRKDDIAIPSEKGESEASLRKTPKADDTRRCIGRKPVTDFVVGQRYSGKIIYMKSFGAFIDIGCHSDAFCHVSRVKDDYVENINDVLKEGDEVSARVVEVDRKDKKITVSLQSDARVQDEQASMLAKRERREKRKRSRPYKTDSSKWQKTNHVDHREEEKVQVPAPAPAKELPPDESTMTPAELKRARKLARRAKRRAQQEETGVAS